LLNLFILGTYRMMENVEYRGYFFVNALYMREVQWGIQSLHCAVAMFARINFAARISHMEITEQEKLEHWAAKDKTIIILNGGNHAELNSLYREILPLALELQLPYGVFNEDEQSLNNATTCVGVIVPDSVYALPLEPIYAGFPANQPAIYGPASFAEDTPSMQLKRILSKYSLAR
jgi:hypothetical protein